MSSHPPSRSPAALSLTAALLLPALMFSRPALCQSAGLPSPQQALGHEIGEDYFLANYTQLSSWWKDLADQSERMVLEEIGTTSYGQTMLMAVISSPENLARRERIREIAGRLARGRDSEAAIAAKLADEGRAVIWIDGGLHATESIAGQNILELVWKMVSGDSPEIHRILDEVILLACPANPDGMEMVANNYMATQRVGSLPVLYQRYVGHDNNRDFYSNNMPESQAIARVLYQRWYPQVVYNHHQTGPRGTVIFTPPFRDPFNYNLDPLVVRGIDLVSAHINQRFTAEGKPGIISETGASYSTWWNGGLRTAAYFHNMIGILTETIGSPTPMRIDQTLNRRLPYGDYPDPIASQEWHARQTIDYLHSSDLAILDLASRYRREFLTNIWTMARDSIERGSQDHWTVTPKLMEIARAAQTSGPADASGRGGRRGGRAGVGRGRRGGAASNPAVNAVFTAPALRDARAYVMPRDQLDPAAVTRFLRALRRNGIDVLVAEGAFEAGGKSYAAGSYVVETAQAFRPHLRDMFEPQYHPDDLGTGGEPVRPYDSAGWTLTMQMGVQADKILDAFDGDFRAVEDVELAFQPRKASRGQAGYLIRHGNSNSFIAGNRLLKAGEQVYWLNQSLEYDGARYPAGTVYVAAGPETYSRVSAMASELGVEVRGIDQAPKGSALQLDLPRIGLFDVYGGNMPTGWTEWILEQFEFPVDLVYGKQIVAGDLRQKYDVLMFLTGLPRAKGNGSNQTAFRRFRQRQPMTDEVLDKIRSAMPPFEDWSNLADRTVALTAENAIPNLEAFVEAGGTLIGIGNSVSSLISHFDLPIKVGPLTKDGNGEERRVRNAEFFIPGSLVWTDVDTSNPIGYGEPARLATMFRRSPVLITQSGLGSPVTYTDEDQLASGWAIGAEFLKGGSAVAGAVMGRGQILLYGADVLYRGQPLASFKLVFNGILAGSATAVTL